MKLNLVRTQQAHQEQSIKTKKKNKKTHHSSSVEYACHTTTRKHRNNYK